MFSDLVGSTALSARMDPEDLREVISAYQTCVARDRAPLRRASWRNTWATACSCILAIRRPMKTMPSVPYGRDLGLIVAVAGLKTRAPLQTRVGIATGLVVVGDLIGAGAAQEQAVVGETPNLAARLRALAEPNMVVIAENTRRLLGNLFDLQDLGKKDLKGLAGRAAGLGQRCARVRSKAVSRRCTRPA